MSEEKLQLERVAHALEDQHVIAGIGPAIKSGKEADVYQQS